MYNKIIKIDCDGVLRDMLPSMCMLYNDYYEDELTPDDIIDFDVNKVFTKCPNPYDFFFKEHADYIYLNSPVCEKAKEAMELLHEKGYHIVIVSTQPSFENQYYTLQWLKENDIYYDSICFTKEKGMIKGHIVVDDYPANLFKCHELEKILIDAPYNKNEKRFKRFNNLYEYAETLMIVNNNNLDIFVCSHKQYESPVHNKVYKTLSLGDNTELYGDNIIRDDTLDNVVDINLFYSELSGYYWIYKNYDIKDYIGFCHYRRYFDFFDNIPDMDKEDCDIILPTPLDFNMSVYNQYKMCHNIEDLLFVINIMANKYKIPINIIFEVMEQTQMCCCNMFITSKEIFKEYCEMFFDICNEYLKHYNIKNIEDVYKLVENNKSKYLKDGYPGDDIKYQSRIGGFLSERIFNIFIKWKNLKVKYVDVVLTEDKYKEKLPNDFI